MMKLEQVFEQVVAEVDTERSAQMVEKLSKFLQVTASVISDDDPHYIKEMPERIVGQIMTDAVLDGANLSITHRVDPPAVTVQGQTTRGVPFSVETMQSGPATCRIGRVELPPELSQLFFECTVRQLGKRLAGMQVSVASSTLVA
jgi:hypothetical protein